MAACPCCGAELIGYERIVTFGKESFCIEIALCCRYCRWQGAGREECRDPEGEAFTYTRDPFL